MFKPEFALTAVGLLAAAISTACGYLLPAGPYCSGAFIRQQFSREAEKNTDGMYAMAALASCHVSARQFAPVWTTAIVVGLVLFTIGLVWYMVKRGKLAPTAWNRSKTSESKAPSTQLLKYNPSDPTWPLLLGIAIVGAGVFLGYTIDVGPYCDGAFAQQTSAAGADIATAMDGKRSSYSDECRAAAGQQAGIYWGIIGFGGAVFVLGLLLRTVVRLRQSSGSRPGALADELEQLARLLERGVLTQEEFAGQKERLLRRG